MALDISDYAIGVFGTPIVFLLLIFGIIVIVGLLFIFIANVKKFNKDGIESDERGAESFKKWGPFLLAIGLIGIVVITILYLPKSNAPIPPSDSISTSTPTPIPTTLALTSTPTSTSPLTPTPTPLKFIIDAMESTMGWYTYKDDKGSSIDIKSTVGRTDNGIEISYNLKEWGWVVISKKINPEILSKYDGLRFYYKGSGEPNTIELKLIYEDNTTFSVVWHRATVTDDWIALETPYINFDCMWPNDNCLRYGNKLDLKNVRKIEFSISNKPDGSDVYGSGKVIIDDVQGTTS